MEFLRIASRIARANPSIYVDLDETLVHSIKRSHVEEEELQRLYDESNGHAIVMSDYITFLRPGAEEFLQSISSMGTLYLCTAASKSYAAEILEEFGLTSYFDDIFARDAIHGRAKRSQSGPTVLIDNLPTGSSDIRAKLRFIGVPPYTTPLGSDPKEDLEKKHGYYSQFHVQVPEFTGDMNDRGLSSIPSKVQSVLAGPE